MAIKYYPSRLAVILLCIPVAISLLLVFDDSYAIPLYILDGVLVLFYIADAMLSRINQQRLLIQINMPHTWSLNRSEDITIEIQYRSNHQFHGRLRIDLPATIRAEPDSVDIHLQQQRSFKIHFKARADRRGRYLINGIHIENNSRIGLWHMQQIIIQKHDIHVYPDLKQMNEYALLARTNRLSLIGVRKMSAVGGDTEFERLREYHSDDAIQRIDWKATARRDELIVREYQPNQSQSIIMMIDAGRMMVSTATDAQGDTCSLLDHAINASLLLAYVALQQGDRVGLIAYANGIQRFIPAQSGERHIHRLIHAVHDLQASLVESRHEEAFLYLQKMERKRSLVVMFTHVLDDVNAMHVEQHCQNLVGRHLPLAVLLRDQDLHKHLEKQPHSSKDFWHAAAAAHICNWRNDLIERLRSHGSLVVDSDPNDLNAGVVSQYLNVKAQHLL
ncbi:MAG: DUF58 domain-containing protein [Planctomycetes bacterium]|nr:DUF58 domain-containing protein [Planctomycetota bacterium]